VAAGAQGVDMLGGAYGAAPPRIRRPASMFLATPDWVRLALVTSRTLRSVTASLACIFAPGSVRCDVGRCQSSMPGTPAKARWQ
jgi:hypothetical protein